MMGIAYHSLSVRYPKAWRWILFGFLLAVLLACGLILNAHLSANPAPLATPSAIVMEAPAADSAATAEPARDDDDPDDPQFAVYQPGMCSYLTEYSYWWYFWNCGDRDRNFNDLMVTVEPISNEHQRVTVKRSVGDGSIYEFSRITRRRQR